MTGRATFSRSTGESKTSQILVPNVVRSIQVCIELIATLAAKEERLRTAIRAMLIPALATGLRGMPGISSDNGDSPRLRFILDKQVESGEAPTMQAALLCAFALRGALPNIRQVLKHNSTARGGMLDDALGEDMVLVSALPKLFLAQLLEVAFRRASAFGLQLSLETEKTAFLLFPALLCQEVPLGGHCQTIQPQVYSNHFLRRRDNRFRDGYDDMKGIASFAEAEISTAYPVSKVLLKVSRNRERQFNPPVHGGKATGHRVPLDPVGALVIANTHALAVRAANGLENRHGLALFLRLFDSFEEYLFFLDLPRQSRFDGFRGFHTGGTYQLSRKSRHGADNTSVCATQPRCYSQW